MRFLRASQRDLRGCRQTAAEDREKLLETALTRATASKDEKKAKAIRAIIRCEATKESFAKLRLATKGVQTSGITAVQVPSEDGKGRDTITNPTDMVPLLIEEGRRHYSQAEGSPFTIYPLADIEYTATCLRANAILEGCSEYERSTELRSEIQQWIKHASRLGIREEDVSRCGRKKLVRHPWGTI